MLIIYNRRNRAFQQAVQHKADQWRSSTMGIGECAIISLKTLNSLFEDRSVGAVLVFENVRCVVCGEPVSVKIQKTSGGYGFLNGIILEPSGSLYLAKCVNCNGSREATGT